MRVPLLFTDSIEQPNCAAVESDNFAWHIVKNLEILHALHLRYFPVKGPIIISDYTPISLRFHCSCSKITW